MGSWLHIGPPYIYININPVIVTIGPFALRWYGLMYAVAILVALWAIRGYVARKGITQDMVYRIVWWRRRGGVSVVACISSYNRMTLSRIISRTPNTSWRHGKAVWPSLGPFSWSFQRSLACQSGAHQSIGTDRRWRVVCRRRSDIWARWQPG